MSTPTKFQLSNVPGFVPNLNSAELEWATYNLTDFQMQQAVAIRARADFAHWVTAGPIDRHRDGIRKQGPICIAYYTHDNVLHMSRVGLRTVLNTASAGG